MSVKTSLEITPEQLRTKMNASLKEVAKMFMQLKERLASLEQRIEAYNKKSSHKI